VLFKQPGRYHWMFQYYLRAQGLSLSWVGTGRCLFSLDFTDEQFQQVQVFGFPPHFPNFFIFVPIFSHFL